MQAAITFSRFPKFCANNFLLSPPYAANFPHRCLSAFPAFAQIHLTLSPPRPDARGGLNEHIIHRRQSALLFPTPFRYFCILGGMTRAALYSSTSKVLQEQKSLEDNLSDWILLLQIQQISGGKSKELDIYLLSLLK